jgi:hypothetical protein
VTDAPPTFEQVKHLIASRKPPLAARVVERRDGAEHRSARVIHDGINGWYVDDGERVELRAAEDRATFVERGTVERIGPGMLATSNNWVKTAIDGRRMADLDDATGEVLGRGEALGRPCWVVRAFGLKGNAPQAVFVLHVDAQTGILLRTEREDQDGSGLEVEELVIGTVVEKER